MFVKHIQKLSFVLIMVAFIFGVTVLSGSGIATIGIMLILLILCIFSQGLFSIEYFIVCTVLQNIVLIICAPYINSSETMLIIIFKEMVVYSICVIYFVRYRLMNMTLQDIAAIVFGGVAVINILRAPSLRLAIVALRQIVVIITCYYFGKGIKRENNRIIKKVIENIIFWGIIVCLAGFILYFCSEQFWLNIGFSEFWANKTSGETSYQFINFYSYDLGFRMKRLVSIFAEPLSCAHFLGIGFVALFVVYERENKYLIQKVLFSIALVMGITKTSLALIASVILIVNYSKIRNKSLKRIFVCLCLLIAIGGMFILSDYTSGLTQATAIGNHFNAFVYGIKNMSLLGNGLGTVGYNAYIMGLRDFDGGYNESFFSLCSAQLGIIGTISLYCFMVMGITNNFKIYQRTGNKYILVSIVLLFEVILESLFSASSISMLGTGLYFALAGMCSNFADS